jgi:cytochrome c peroxidase
LTTTFNDTFASGAADDCNVVSDAVSHGGSGFEINGVNTRRVEPRNTPSVFNAIFNFRNFWDGRANNVFNGSNPFGMRDTIVQVWKMDNDKLKQMNLSLPTAALASLGSGPPLSENEMSCKNRTFAKIAKKLVNNPVLADQTISPKDSVLGPIAQDKPTYAALIKRAFKPEYWNSPSPVPLKLATAAESQIVKSMDLAKSQRAIKAESNVAPEQISQMEANFTMFFGMAIQLYQATLVSDDTPFDRYVEGDANALNAKQLRGLAIFRGPTAQCVHCHAGAEFTSASTSNVKEEGRLDHRLGANGTTFRYDNGFFNTGVRPTKEDIGVGGTDPYGYPLSETRLSQSGKYHMLGDDFDDIKELPGRCLAGD